MQETTDQPPPTVVAEKSPMTEARIAAEAEGDDVFEMDFAEIPQITRSLSSSLPPMPRFSRNTENGCAEGGEIGAECVEMTISPPSVIEVTRLGAPAQGDLPRSRSLERAGALARSLERSKSLALERSRSLTRNPGLSRSWNRRRHALKNSEAPTPETVSETITLLNDYPSGEVVQSACDRLRQLAKEGTTRWSAIRAGAVDAVVERLKAHPDEVDVLQNGYVALLNLCREANMVAPDVNAKSYRDVVSTVVSGMLRHPSSHAMQEHGANIIASLASGDSAAAAICRQRAIECNALQALVKALEGAFGEIGGVQAACCRAMAAIFKHKAPGLALDSRAARAGVVPAVVKVVKKPADSEAGAASRLALRAIANSSTPLKRQAHKSFGGFSFYVALKL
mmetsp:Transcript_26238/g.57503  ORF Transcript_26238/g.57503 Transcript_26238/m.57503 type:complete len:396 (+) Transcript_26238:494-1681(+)